MNRLNRLATAVASTLAVLAASGCAGEAVPDDARARPQASFADPGLAHVHGLGVDPADGVLYAATHFGVFALPEGGEATRVADRFQDTMGFTVAGPSTFLGSGHPDVGKDPHLPPRLGLIRSTDAARTWETVSLTGEVDFHVLHARHGSIYGWDAGSRRLMASDDEGSSWQTRSTLALRDFVVSPDDPQLLLATTPEGLQRSTDGGRTFSTVPGPMLSVLAWDVSAQLYGISPQGELYLSGDGGGSWTRRAELQGEPEALTAHGGVLYAAIAGRGILTSEDGGRTWTVLYTEPSGS